MSESDITYSVADLTRIIKNTLEGQFPSLWVSGEISNFIAHRSGHMYFTLKDDRAEIKSVMFKGNNQFLRFRPENGMQVLVRGRLTVYEARGYYQIVASKMEPAGIGTLFLAYEALKKQLLAEGLFDEVNKKPLPAYPKRVGIITSATGAAIRDITQILQRRAPYVQLIIRPTLVQGDTAAADIVQALNDFAEYGDVDAIILGRGGGSLEDLWPFNEEIVARAIHKHPIPIISAVGHETDTTISDLAADMRAPTPSAAAELVAPARDEILGNLSYFSEKITLLVRRDIERRQQNLDSVTSRYGFRQPQQLLDATRDHINQLTKELVISVKSDMKLARSNLSGLDSRLQALSPVAILKRGYALAVRSDDGRIVRGSDDLEIGEKFDLRLGNGSIEAEKTADLKKKRINKASQS